MSHKEWLKQKLTGSENINNVSERQIDVWEFRYNLLEILLAMEADNTRREEEI